MSLNITQWQREKYPLREQFRAEQEWEEFRFFLGQTNLLLGNHDNVFKALQIKFYSEEDGSNDGSWITVYPTDELSRDVTVSQLD